MFVRGWPAASSSVLSAGALGSAILLAGGWNWPALACLVAIAVGLMLICGFSGVPNGWMDVSLFLLAAFYALQGIDVGSALSLLSPRAAQLREAILGSASGSISYEAAASFREAAKYAVYGAVVWAARARRPKDGMLKVALAVTVGSLLMAAIHMAVGEPKLYAIYPWKLGAEFPSTTLVNPNHAASLCGMAAFAAAALASSERRRRRRAFLILAAFGLGCVCLFQDSLAGSASFLGMLLLGAVLAHRTVHSSPILKRWTFVGAATALLVVVISGLRFVAIGNFEQALGPKLDGVRDVQGIVQDHWLLGIGRGSFVSVYPHYKTSELNLTFSFPENLLAQHVTESGLVIGLMTVGLLFTMAIGQRARPQARERWLQCGSAFFLVHESLDFGSEIPGLMLLFLTLVCAQKTTGRRTIRRRGYGTIPLTIVGVGLLIATAMAAHRGDLDRAERRIDDMLGSSTPRPGRLELAEAYSHRHFANGVMWTKLANLQELSIETTADLGKALETVNRGLLTHPTYPDVHLVAGRLLILAGHRRQGLGEFRRAWELAWNGRRVAEQIVKRVAEPSDLEVVLPRRPDGVTPEPGAAAWLSKWARLHAPEPRYRAKMRELLPPAESVSSPALLNRLRSEASALGRSELALDYAMAYSDLAPEDCLGWRTLWKLCMDLERKSEAQEAWRRLGSCAGDGGELALGRLEKLIATSSVTVDGELIREITSQTRGPARNKVMTIGAEVLMAQGDWLEAEAFASIGLKTRPDNIRLRLVRARAYAALGRTRSARRDLEHILKQSPEHKRARRLLETWNNEASGGGPP